MLETIIRQGKEGTTIKTEPKDYDGYRLTLRPQVEEYVLGEEDITVNYYYSKITEGIEKYIDVINEELLETETIEGIVGETYETAARNIEGYTLATNRRYYMLVAKKNPNFLSDNGVSSVEEYMEKEKLDPDASYIPENSKGLMKEGVEVKYYYMPKINLKVKYVDVNYDEEIQEGKEDTSVVIEGNLDEPYETEAKDFDDYLRTSNKTVYKKYIQENPEVLDENGVETVEEYLDKENIDPKDRYVPENAKGIMDVVENEDGTYNKEIEVTYYYGKKRTVTIKYVDKETGKEVEEEITAEGPEGDDYSIEDSLKQIEGYTLVEKPDTTEGVYNKNNVSKTYYYAKNSQIIVKYVDKDTGKVIDENANYVIDGYEGKEYETIKKTFEGYTYLDSTKNTEGTMGEENIEVIYYYKSNTSNNTNTTVEHQVIVNSENKVINESKETVVIAENTTQEPVTRTIIIKDVEEKVVEKVVEKDDTKKDNEAQKIVTPNTGDNVPLIACSTIAILLAMNLILYVGQKKSEKRPKGKRWAQTEKKKKHFIK